MTTVIPSGLGIYEMMLSWNRGLGRLEVIISAVKKYKETERKLLH